MDNKDTSNQYDGEEVVEVEAVEVEADPAETVNEDKGTVEDVLPPFLERDARVREGAQAEDLQASEVEPDTQGKKVRAEETQDGSISLQGAGGTTVTTSGKTITIGDSCRWSFALGVIRHSPKKVMNTRRNM